ncbi:MAG: FG-GAP repeat domain-containing protein [Hasllibacter sp.]
MRVAALALAALLPGWAAACEAPDPVPGSVVDAPAPASAPGAAWYEGLTDAYPHGALGDPFEPTVLAAAIAGGCPLRVAAGPGRVFEDLAPRLADLDGDGRAEVIAIRSDAREGAQVVVYAARGGALVEIAATAPIGTRFRWLAISGIADLDGDGRVEIAYVDRPHLAKVGRIVTYLPDGRLFEIARIADVTNHAFGAAFVEGGLRTCDGRPEIVWLSGDRTRILATALFDEGAGRRDIGAHTPAALDAAMACQKAS